MGTAQMRKTVQPVHADVEDSDEFYETRMPSSARRYRQSAPPIPNDTLDDPEVRMPIIQRRRAVQPITRYPQQGPEERTTKTEALLLPQKKFPLVPVLVGMVMMVLLFMTIGAIGSWWQGYQDDLHYGLPRTSHLDAVVGHGDSKTNETHFVFMNLHGHVDVIEIPGGDTTRMRVYTGPILYGDKADLIPVTGEVRDVNHDGLVDLIVHVRDQQIVYLNDGKIFKQQ
jgi:hypothetical protein